MELKVGQKLWAICDHFYQNRKCLTKDKEYAIHAISIGSGIIVLDDTMEAHGFSYENIGKYFTTEPPKTERYFIVFYYAKTDVGIFNAITDDGTYVNCNEIISDIKEKLGIDNLTLTNIIELNKQDYESWNK